jgi:hypothetical protein
MNNYFDKWGRVHDKPVTDANPIPSNNGWIYSAYLDKAGYKLDLMMMAICFRQCKQINPETGQLFLVRSPFKETPPISRDEILGMAQIGFLRQQHLDGWNFSPYPVPAFNPIKLVAQLIQMQGKDRNYFWQNNLDQIYRFAFSVPLADRHFILEKWGRFNLFYYLIAKVDSLFKSKNGLGWLKYDQDIKAMQAEFPEDHPLRMY